MKRNKFSLSHTRLLSCDMGELIPIGLTEVLPGDTIQQASTCLVRLAPMLAPIMHQVNVHIAHFFVPHRLVWSGWENFITGGPDGNNTDTPPYAVLPAGPQAGQIYDYMGVPPVTNASVNVSALPGRGYNLIWNEWYRDQDLQTARIVNLTSGNDSSFIGQLARVNWEKDYFTSARPWEQKGPTVTIPLGTTAPIVVKGPLPVGAQLVKTNTNNTGVGALSPAALFGTNASSQLQRDDTDVNVFIDVSPSHYVDLQNASAVTVNILRQALAIQRFEEARARYGSRYTEYLRYLGVRSSDARLQKPEYLGGGRYPIQISEVLSSQTGVAGEPLGTMGGHGIGAARSARFRRFFEEHGFIHSLMSIRPKAIYQDGLHRHWTRWTKEDYFQKELQHIGQQKVLNKEVWFQTSAPDGVFGYQDRYDEYRSHPSTVHGEFRTSLLNFWHLARTFAAQPALNNTFVTCTPTEVPFAVPSKDVAQVMVRNSIQARRIVSKTGSSFIL